jgi:hypothetical protein
LFGSWLELKYDYHNVVSNYPSKLEGQDKTLETFLSCLFPTKHILILRLFGSWLELKYNYHNVVSNYPSKLEGRDKTPERSFPACSQPNASLFLAASLKSSALLSNHYDGTVRQVCNG